MKKNYKTPDIELVKIVSEEIMALSCNTGSGSGTVIDWDDWKDTY